MSQVFSKIPKHKKTCRHFAKYISRQKNTKRNPHFKRFSGILPNCLQALLERQDTKIEIQKNMPALRLKYFQKKKHKKKNTAVNHEIFLQALLERQNGERRRWREETELRTLDMEHQV